MLSKVTHPGTSLRTIAVAVGALAISTAAMAQLADYKPEILDIEIEQKLDAPVPMDLEFVNAEGESVRLGDLFLDDRPTILSLNYYRCPQLCGLTLNAMIDQFRDLEDLSIGREFNVVTVSINPDEGPREAKAKQDGYLKIYDRDGAESAWSFLTGTQENIEALAAATGFGYRYDKRSGEYSHKSVIMFVTPEGHIARYWNPIGGKVQDMRLALTEASQGAIGSPIDQFLLFTCFQYDPESGSYVASAWKIMRTGGVVTMVVLFGGLVALWRRGSKYDEQRVPTGMPAVSVGEMH